MVDRGRAPAGRRLDGRRGAIDGRWQYVAFGVVVAILVTVAVVGRPGGAIPPGGTATPGGSQAASAPPGPSGAALTIDASTVAGQVSPDLIGANVAWNTGDQLADAGSDGRTDAAVAAFLRAGMDLHLLAFPGGEMANCYDWRQGVGPQASRGNQAGWSFGPGGCIDQHTTSHLGTAEFMTAMAAAAPNARAVIIVNVCSTVPARHCGLGSGTQVCPDPPATCPGATTLGADWVQYLNGAATDPSKPWAQLRARSGHPAPYGVHDFQLGNELYNDPTITPASHAAVVHAYVAAMKAEDPTIAVGATLDDSGKRAGWNEDLARDGGVDFLVPHEYGPNFSDAMTGLAAGPAERWQAWGFDTAAGGPAELDVDAAQWSTSGRAALDLVVDGNPALSVRGAPLTDPYEVARTALALPSLPAGHHRLLVGLAERTGGPAVRVMGARVCAPACRGGTARPIDVGISAADPDAIRPLVAGGTSQTFAAPVTAAAASTLSVEGFGMAAGAPCPAATIAVDGTVRATLDTGGGSGAAPCHDAIAPATVAVPIGAGPHSVVVTSTGGEVDLAGARVASAGGAAAPLDLTLNPGGLQSVAVHDALSATSGFDYWLTIARRFGLPILITEWNIWTDYTTVAFAGFEDVRAALFEALALQEFERTGVAGAALWTIDNGDGFRLIHCNPQSAHDEPGTCLARSAAPSAALPAVLFSMLRGAIDTSLLATTVTAPQLTEAPLLDGDGSVVARGGEVLTQLQATATRSASAIHVLVVNAGGTPLDVAVALEGAEAARAATMSTLTGPLDAVNGCRRTALDEPVGCGGTPITPVTATVPSPGGSAMTLHLPADSVSVLTVPLAGA